MQILGVSQKDNKALLVKVSEVMELGTILSSPVRLGNAGQSDISRLPFTVVREDSPVRLVKEELIPIYRLPPTVVKLSKPARLANELFP